MCELTGWYRNCRPLIRVLMWRTLWLGWLVSAPCCGPHSSVPTACSDVLLAVCTYCHVILVYLIWTYEKFYRFSSSSDVQKLKVQRFRRQLKEFFADGILRLVHQWGCCLYFSHIGTLVTATRQAVCYNVTFRRVRVTIFVVENQ